MRRLHNEHHGTKACNDADSCPTLRTRVRGIYLTAPFDAQAGTEVQTGLLPRLQSHFAGALYGDAVEVLARIKHPQNEVEDAVIAQFALRSPLGHREVR